VTTLTEIGTGIKFTTKLVKKVILSSTFTNWRLFWFRTPLVTTNMIKKAVLSQGNRANHL